MGLKWFRRFGNRFLPVPGDPVRGRRWTILGIAGVCFLGLVILVLGVFVLSHQATQPPVAEEETGPVDSISTPVFASLQPWPGTLDRPNAEDHEEDLLAIAVRGAVRKPGFYRMPRQSRVYDLIQEAGGTNDEADLDDINIAAYLLDGATLTIPVRPLRQHTGESMVLRGGSRAGAVNPAAYTRSGWRPVPVPPDVAAQDMAETALAEAAGDGLIDINHATQKELETLPGIGPITAEKIIAYRRQTPFTRIEDIQNVSGIASGKFEAVKELITVR